MIRELTMSEKEVNLLMDVWLRSVKIGHPFIPYTYWQQEYKSVRDDYLPQSKTFVYEEQGEIKGFISMIGEEFIGALFVDVPYQKQGIGKKLMEYVKEKRTFLRLAVYCRNESAVLFYKRNGFKVECTEMNEDTGEDNYIMAWKGDFH